jgi:MFS family permease
MKRFFLEIVVFVCGAVVMAYEIIGSRMLGPYVGTSYEVWTSIIGIILLSLSLGYYLGGRIADRRPFFGLFSLIIVLASFFIFLSTLVKDILLDYLLKVIVNINLVSILASILLFAVPALLLGMVSPFAVRLKIKNLQTSGLTVGNLYAISTMGSIVGTFLAGFYLIPSFRITLILYLLAGILLLFASLFYLTYKDSIPQTNSK